MTHDVIIEMRSQVENNVHDVLSRAFPLMPVTRVIPGCKCLYCSSRSVQESQESSLKAYEEALKRNNYGT